MDRESKRSRGKSTQRKEKHSKTMKRGKGRDDEMDQVQDQEDQEEEEEDILCEEDLESMNESEEVPEGPLEIPEEVTENPFGFQFSASVTQCFAKEPVEDDKVIFFSGNEYHGEINEGIIHGNGTYKWTELGATYTGTFSWGNFTGVGRLEWKDGSTYEGSVVNGIRHGQGVYRKGGDKVFVYDGEWKHGQFDGEGTCYYGELGCKHKYVGHFEKGLREGHGTMYYPNGNVYEGEWHLGKRHGHGKFTWADSGSYYIGDFVDGEMHGKGEIIYAFSAQSPSVQFVQSNRYLGEFEHSLRSGNGVFYYANGAVYKGEWKDNMKNGQGKFTSRDGRVYHSEFRDGSIYQDGKLFVPTPSISLNFPLDGLLAPSESADEVMNSLCNIYVRFLPKLRALYQQYSKIQWADDKTITALRMVGMWRFLQDKGSVLDAEFRLSDADEVIQWKLEKPSLAKVENSVEKALTLQSTFGVQKIQEMFAVATLANQPLAQAPDPFATLFLYQLFESLVRLAHHKLSESFPDSLILQVTRFLENAIFVDDEPPQNEYSIFRKTISTPEFDDVITKYSPELIKLYIDFSGYSMGCSRHQIRQLESGMKIDPNVDVTIREYQGIMTIRDLLLFLGDRGFFEQSNKLTVMDVLLFQKFSSVARALEEGEEENFRKYFTAFPKCKVTFVEFVQTLAFVGSRLIPYHDWELIRSFEYVVEHLSKWIPPTPPSSEAEEHEEEEEKPQEQTPPASSHRARTPRSRKGSPK